MSYLFSIFIYFCLIFRWKSRIASTKHVTLLGKSISTPSIAVQVCGTGANSSASVPHTYTTIEGVKILFPRSVTCLAGCNSWFSPEKGKKIDNIFPCNNPVWLVWCLDFIFYISGENHELHPAKHVTLLGKSISTPSIVVQVCGTEALELAEHLATTRRIKQTKCPDRQNSLD